MKRKILSFLEGIAQKNSLRLQMIIESFTIRKRRYLLLAILIGTAGGLFLNPLSASAAVRTSTVIGGTWATGSTWVGSVAPSSTDDAIIATTGGNTVNIGTSTSIVNLTINPDATLTHSSNRTLNVTGNYTNNGIHTTGISAITLSGSGATIDGSGTVGGTGQFVFSAAKTIAATASLTVIQTNAITAAVTITNNGTINANADITGSAAGSTWINAANSTLNISGALLATGTLTASANPNTINYNGGAQTVKAPTTSYHHLTLSNSAAKTPASSLTIDGDLTLSDTAALSNTNNPSFNIAGNVQVAAGNTWTKGTGTITLAGTSSTQTINFAGKTVEDIVIDASGATKQFTGAVTTDSFTATNGTIDFNGQTITTTDNFTMGTGSQVIADANAMDGAVINVGGNCDLDGQNGDPLIFKWMGSGNDAWTLAVTGNIDMDYVTFTPASTNTMALHVSGPTATASNVIVDYSDADGGFTTIDATDGTNTNGGHNTNWLFTVLSVTLRNADDTADYTTWALGSGKDLDTVYIMNNTECVLVKNNGGPAAEDFSISATGTNWTLGDTTDLDTCVLMGLFNGNSAPVTGDFSTTYDIINGTTRWATTSGGVGNYEGTNDGDNVAASTGEKLYIYLKTPSSLSQGSEESITVTVGCREH